MTSSANFRVPCKIGIIKASGWLLLLSHAQPSPGTCLEVSSLSCEARIRPKWGSVVCTATRSCLKMGIWLRHLMRVTEAQGNDSIAAFMYGVWRSVFFWCWSLCKQMESRYLFSPVSESNIYDNMVWYKSFFLGQPFARCQQTSIVLGQRSLH